MRASSARRRGDLAVGAIFGRRRGGRSSPDDRRDEPETPMRGTHHNERMSTPRQRYRDQVRSEIKQIALVQIGEGGAAALSLNAVAKQLGVTGPALYKYFRSRDDLLTELILEGFDEVASAVRAAAGEGAPRERLHALARAFHGWAVANPHLFQLLAGTSSPGYDAPRRACCGPGARSGPSFRCSPEGTAARGPNRCGSRCGGGWRRHRRSPSGCARSPRRGIRRPPWPAP
ncbi:hypothetical protein GCM10027612_02630 [Microbispora bryophytorum subsp. camponoti]